MRNPESPPPVEMPNEADIPLKERLAIFEKLTKIFPELKSAVLAFAVTSAAMAAPESAEARDARPLNTGEQTESVRSEETAEDALANVSDERFTLFARNIETEINRIGSTLPDNAVFSEVRGFRSIDSGYTSNEDENGNLPESAQNVLIGNEQKFARAWKTSVVNGGEASHSLTEMKSAFFVSPAEEEVVPEGEKIEMAGIGSTESEALQNALEHSVMFMGEGISSQGQIHTRAAEASGLSSRRDTFSDVVESDSKHYVKEYAITERNEIQTKDGTEWRVTVEVQPGTQTPENE